MLLQGETVHNLEIETRGRKPMKQEAFCRRSLSRRSVIAGGAGLAGALLASSVARAQQPNANIGTPASVITNPPRDWNPRHP